MPPSFLPKVTQSAGDKLTYRERREWSIECDRELTWERVMKNMDMFVCLCDDAQPKNKNEIPFLVCDGILLYHHLHCCCCSSIQWLRTHTNIYEKKNSRIMNILRSLVIILLFVTKWWCWFVVGVHIFTDQKAFILKQRYLLLFLLIIEMHQTNIHNNSADYDGWLTAMWWRVCTKNVLHIAYCNMYRSIIKSGSCHIICMHTK